ncbi:MAG: ABC transporter permease [Ignavibacteriales bacterium]|nr:ABC transporter permease [Ignavibacteriales bacterium]
MAILIGTGLVYKEIDKKTIFTLLAKPLHRAEFILGKFLGLVLTLLVMTAAMTADLPGPRLRPHAQDRDRPCSWPSSSSSSSSCSSRPWPSCSPRFSTPILSSALRPRLLPHRAPVLEPRDASSGRWRPAPGRPLVRALYTDPPRTSRTSTSRRRSSTACPSRRASTSRRLLYGVCYAGLHPRPGRAGVPEPGLHLKMRAPERR